MRYQNVLLTILTSLVCLSLRKLQHCKFVLYVYLLAHSLNTEKNSKHQGVDKDVLHLNLILRAFSMFSQSLSFTGVDMLQIVFKRFYA